MQRITMIDKCNNNNKLTYICTYEYHGVCIVNKLILHHIIPSLNN